jgi:hypothetical protein
MMNEAIATPGPIQQATDNPGGSRRAINLRRSATTTFNGKDEFTRAAPKKGRRTIRARHNADDIIFGGLGDDWLHGGSGDDAILGGEALDTAYTQVYDHARRCIGVARSDYTRPYNPVDAAALQPDDPERLALRPHARAGEFALYDEYDPLRRSR